MLFSEYGVCPTINQNGPRNWASGKKGTIKKPLRKSRGKEKRMYKKGWLSIIYYLINY